MKTRNKTLLSTFFAVLLCFLVIAPASHAAEDFRGNWTISSSSDPGHIRFGLIYRRDGGHSQSEMDWPLAELKGLDLAATVKHDVKFVITRDAGRIDCEGYMRDGEGAGLFHFTPDLQFPKSMGVLGFNGVDDEMQFAMAVHDVSLDFAKAIKAEKLNDLTTDKLLAFRIHGVTPKFIQEIRAAGLSANDSDKLIAFRIHGVTPEWVSDVRKWGLKVSEDELIAFRIHGVTPAFIASVEKLGYQGLEPEQLIAMRIHGVTPEYINEMKSRGLKNLTIDQLVNLRIHDID
jgi:hypothetical protein